MDNKKLNEFITLLQTKDKKLINKWKQENHYLYNDYYNRIHLCKDVDVIYHLYVARTFDNGEEADKRVKEILNYVKYINEEDEDVKWISAQKKKEFFEKKLIGL